MTRDELYGLRERLAHKMRVRAYQLEAVAGKGYAGAKELRMLATSFEVGAFDGVLLGEEIKETP